MYPQTPPDSATPTSGLRRTDINDVINQLVGPRSPRSSTPAGSAGPSTPTLAPRNFSPSGRSGRGSDRGAALLGEAINGPTSGRVSRGSDTGSDIPGHGKTLQTSPPSDAEARAYAIIPNNATLSA